MIKRPFFSLGGPKLKYPVVEDLDKDSIQEISLPGAMTLLLKQTPMGSADINIKVGDSIRTGQRLKRLGEREGYLTSTATGTVTDVSEYLGYLGETYTSISIDTAALDQWDDRSRGRGEIINFETTLRSLTSLPAGDSDFAPLLDPRISLNTIVINGIDKDLLVTTNQLIVKTEIDALTEGVAYLKEITGDCRIIILVPPHLASLAGKTGAEVKAVHSPYPDAFPEMVMMRVLGKTVDVGRTPEDMGVGFIGAEAVSALAKAFSNGHVPVNKVVTVIKKDYSTVHVKARIGTPVKHILETLNIETAEGDRLVLGGPMNGIAVYSEDMPVLSDTDAIMIQDKDRIISSSDSVCVNCGECVRACPAKIPVNMLVRVLENGLYEEAAQEYDLLSCIECGLCSYVCIARIPVFQYIMLGKYEFARIEKQEDPNA